MNLVEIGEEVGFIPKSHSRVAINSNKGYRTNISQIIKNKQLPDQGLSDAEVKMMLAELGKIIILFFDHQPLTGIYIFLNDTDF